MAKNLFLLFSLVVLPAIVSARFYGEPFLVIGKAYCDNCRCGYETEASEYIKDAVVQIECRDRKSNRVTYTSEEAVTNSSGYYEISVYSDRGDDCCDAVLVRNPDSTCSVPNKGRDRARVVLTRNNGMTSMHRFANAMGFLRNEALAGCPMILKKYEAEE